MPATEADPLEREGTQSVGVSRMFGSPVSDVQGLEEAVSTYAAAAAVKLRKAGKVASAANVFVQECAPPGTGGRKDENWWTPFLTVTVTFEAPTLATPDIFGRGTVFFASEGTERKWKMKREMLSGCPTIRGNQLMSEVQVFPA